MYIQHVYAQSNLFMWLPLWIVLSVILMQMDVEENKYVAS